MTTSPSTVRTRFAPSPSGHLHVGGARTALFCWAFALQHGGRFILRIEDTDRKRSSEAASQGFLDDLRWLGVTWDEGPVHEGTDRGRSEPTTVGGGDHGPYVCSQRLDVYERVIDEMIEAGTAYRAFETPEELAAARQLAESEKRPYRYDRAALALEPGTVQQYLAEERPHVVRFRLHDGLESVVVEDLVAGTVTTPASELDDFVIRKADGWPTYHFAVVVDDAAMKVTHVIRGQEHLTNTARHQLLQDALGYPRPVYAHVSTIQNPDGSKMSKRDKDRALRAEVRRLGLEAPPDADGRAVLDPERWAWWLAEKTRQLELAEAEGLAAALDVALPEIDVDDFRRNGYLPEVLVNYLALLGWSPADGQDRFTPEQFVERFTLDRLVSSAAKFDREKLLAFNQDAIQAMDPAELARRLAAHARERHPAFLEALGAAQMEMLAESMRDRARTLEDPFVACRYFVLDDDAIEYVTGKPFRKAMLKGEPCGYDHLERIRGKLAGLDDWSADSIQTLVDDDAERDAGGQMGKVAQPIRIAVTGGTVSPAIGNVLAVLGKDSTLRRIDRCLAMRAELAEA